MVKRLLVPLFVVLALTASLQPTSPAEAATSGQHSLQIDRLYRAYFLRDPDPAGLSYWTGRRNAGVPLSTVSAEFARSAEFVSRYGTLGHREFVDLVYRNVLGRAADPAGADYWSGLLSTGSTDRGTVMTGFSESIEFKVAQGHLDPGPVDRLYRAFFLRSSDAQGRNYWLDQFERGASLRRIADVFAASPEFVARYGALDDGGFVDLVYANVLGRAPDATGRAYWIGQLARGMSRGTMMTGFSESTEFGGPGSSTREIGGCPVFPADSFWNARVDDLPVHPQSDTFISSIGRTRGVHADFGAGLWEGHPIGIPYTVTDGAPGVGVTFDYDDESDPAPYPIPRNAPIEGGSDHHILVVDSSTCVLHELFDATWQANGTIHAGSGARWNMNSNAFRPLGWTSADAAGLPILPGLVRYDEVASGSIDHAIRFTAPLTANRYVWPATHHAGRADAALPPMGSWVRLDDSVDPAAFTGQARVIVEALRTHGAILADNGSAWYLSGAPDERWDNDDLRQLRGLTGADFEVVDASGLMVGADSGATRP